ncbi:hypothetical protein [Candidatus Blastococcus massiliensis]|uniref:hypothetical protein n=1 Tax=Candidatus Blastococcus massiliensis TaxID=1470358 RepID=UPI0004ADD825|nr:hypothetical protein [Candidatus Blastococcus massiliensis]
MTAPTSRSRTAGERIAHLARRAVELEIGVWQSLYRFLLRRPRVPEGATAFTYHRVVLPVIIAFIVISAIELVVVDFLVHRWPAVRIPLLVVGVWGLTWMFGLLAGMVTRPHAVGPQGIRVRYSTDVDVDVPWDAIDSVTRRTGNREEKAPRLARNDDGDDVLHLWMHDQTTIDVVLDRPVEVRLPEGAATLHRIALFADDPTAFLASVRAHVERAQAS